MVYCEPSFVADNGNVTNFLGLKHGKKRVIVPLGIFHIIATISRYIILLMVPLYIITPHIKSNISVG